MGFGRLLKGLDRGQSDGDDFESEPWLTLSERTGSEHAGCAIIILVFQNVQMETRQNCLPAPDAAAAPLVWLARVIVNRPKLQACPSDHILNPAFSRPNSD